MKSSFIKIAIFTTVILCGFSISSLSAQEKKSDTIVIASSVRCNMCKERIEGNLAFEKGIKDVIVDLDKSTVTVRFNPKTTNPEEIRRKITKLGYDADEMAADPKVYEKLPACCKKDAPKHE